MNKHLEKVSSLGCIVCGGTACIHHPRFAVGMSQRASDYLGIPLCPEHHQHGAYGHAVHNGYREFAKNYMSEEEMLAETIRRLCK